jgi:hypothetical protein
LLLLLALFCPVRYHAEIRKESESMKEVWAAAGVSWLFHLISFGIRYEDGAMTPILRICGIPILKLRSWFKERRKKKSNPVSGKASKNTPSKQEAQPRIPKKIEAEPPKADTGEEPPVEEFSQEAPKSAERESAEDQSVPPPEEETIESQEPKPEKNPELDASESERNPVSGEVEHEENPEFEESGFEECLKPEESEHKDNSESEESESEENPEPEKPGSDGTSQPRTPAGERLRRFWNKCCAFLERLRKLPERISEAIRDKERTYKRLQKKINWWKRFLNHPRFRAAATLLWDCIRRILRHVAPTKVTGHVTFGCEDPSITGGILAVLGITIPFHKNRIKVTPLFDAGNQLRGEIQMKGRIYGIVFVVTFFRLYFNKNIKYVIYRWKKKKEG